MNLATMCTEHVVVHHHRTGAQSTAKAMVQSKTIFIPNDQVPIEPNDVIERTIPSGVVERYIVEDPGFINRIHGIPSHYQVKARREGVVTRADGGHSIHVTGANSRVNIGSTDHSTNRVDLAALEDGLLSELQRLRRELLARAGDSAENYVTIGTVAAAEAAVQQGDEAKASALLGGLGKAGGWVLGVARDIGVKLAAEIILKHSGA
jgi:hypothetical protein